MRAYVLVFNIGIKTYIAAELALMSHLRQLKELGMSKTLPANLLSA